MENQTYSIYITHRMDEGHSAAQIILRMLNDRFDHFYTGNFTLIHFCNPKSKSTKVCTCTDADLFVIFVELTDDDIF